MLEFCSIGFLLPGGSFTRFMYRSKSCQQPCLALDNVLFLFEVRSASLECYVRVWKKPRRSGYQADHEVFLAATFITTLHSIKDEP